MKKVDSSVFMHRHALQSKARDDRESNNSKPTTQAEGFLMIKQGCEAFCAEIRLDRLSLKLKASSLLYRKTSEAVRAQRSRFL